MQFFGYVLQEENSWRSTSVINSFTMEIQVITNHYMLPQINTSSCQDREMGNKGVQQSSMMNALYALQYAKGYHLG